MMNSLRALALLLRLVLGGIFLYSGILKLDAPAQFADSIASFEVLPTFLIIPFALSLPPLEILLGAMLISNWHIREAILITFLLYALFLTALIQAFARGLTVDCGCFGSSPSFTINIWLALARNTILLISTIVVLKYICRSGCVRPSCD